MKQNISSEFAISIIVILVVFFGGMFFLISKREDVNVPMGRVMQETRQNNVDSSVVKTDTSDWKTYKNDTYGFSIDYPKDWTVNDKQQDCKPTSELMRTIPDLMTAGAGICRISFSSFGGYDTTNGMDRTLETWPKDGFVVSLNVTINPQKLSANEYLKTDKEAAAEPKQSFVYGSAHSFVGFKNGIVDGRYFGPLYYEADPKKQKDVIFEISGAFGGTGKPSDDVLSKNAKILENMLGTWQSDQSPYIMQ